MTEKTIIKMFKTHIQLQYTSDTCSYTNVQKAQEDTKIKDTGQNTTTRLTFHVFQLSQSRAKKNSLG